MNEAGLDLTADDIAAVTPYRAHLAHPRSKFKDHLSGILADIPPRPRSRFIPRSRVQSHPPLYPYYQEDGTAVHGPLAAGDSRLRDVIDLFNYLSKEDYREAKQRAYR
jgi:hypothetical protein